jgi:protein ImuA
MANTKADIIARLEKEILPLQGYRPTAKIMGFDGGLGPIKYAFPNASFPLGAVHEFFCTGLEDTSASSGFIAGILSSVVNNIGAALWISSSQTIFPPALKAFGIEPEKIVFINVRNEKERLWVMEEALKCSGLSAVVGEIQEASFKESRRLQLAVEQSGVTGFVLRRNPKNLATACVSRWRIKPLPSAPINNLPGVGFARWNVALLKVRNGKPGSWEVEWAAGSFRHTNKLTSISKEQHRKAG